MVLLWGYKNLRRHIMHNITNNLRHLMQNKNITPIDLASELSVSPELIVKLKNGELKNPSLNTVIGISTHFGISLENLVFGKID